MKTSAKTFSYRFLSFLLCILFLFPLFSFTAIAQTYPANGVVNDDGVRVRSVPNTGSSNTVLALVNSGHSVTVLSQHPDGNGGSIPWYRVSLTKDGSTITGYIRTDLVNIISQTPSAPPNADFETQLSYFPESYHQALRTIHAQHPSWNFEAVIPGLDWGAIQNLENRLGWSYINDGVISHYSTAAGAYNWETDTYYVKEGSNWYQAHPDMVAYYMDPRNFLNENDIFQFEKLSFSAATQTEENIASMMQGTFMEGKTTVNEAGETVSYARAFLDAAQRSNVSAFHLVTRCIQEVGRDGTGCSLGTYPGYEGYYNFFSIGAYTGALDGMIHAKNQGWDTPYKAIQAGGSVIGGSYISNGQDTPYFQKYDVESASSPVTRQYMTNIAAPSSEGRIQRGKYVTIGMLESAFTFRIPVFSNMPASPCPKVPVAGSPNNYLKSLSIEGYSLTPSFDFYESLNNGVCYYTLVIPQAVSSIQVSASAVSSSASLSGDIGNVSLSAGENLLKIHCTSASGSTRTYQIAIANGGGTLPPPAPSDPGASGWNPSYSVSGNIITGIAPGTDSSAFLGALGLYGSASAHLTDSAGNAISGTMRTGMILHFFNGSSATQYKIVIYGEVNGDGFIDAIDLLLVRKNLLGLTSFDNAQGKAADVNRDGVVDAIDLLLVRKNLLGLHSISQ